MSMTTLLLQVLQWVGIDVSKRTLDVHIRPQGMSFQVSNDESGITELLKQLEGFSIGLIVLEATGGFQTLAARSYYSRVYQRWW
jgi:transposase